ncbi:MAG: rod shape-determining protein RodA [Spirochaetae bacterium HGW-Spirochaetae-3]|jgi:rod shape determining protein RodA|nr:MAG: rod shape-determining protein RodA [Spirochaetae bacterium HGW-Spirochaetae-3]
MATLRNLAKAIDWTIILAISILMVIGILFIYSSGVTSAGDIVSAEYTKQIVWSITGLALLLAAILVDTKRIFDYMPLIYGFFIAILVYTRVFGKVVNGARSWIGLFGDYGIQPSEFMKIATALFLAYYLEKSSHESSSFKRFIASFSIVALPMGLILIQPDFGTALVFVPLYLAMAYIGGINRRYLLSFILTGGIAIILTVMPLWQQLIVAKPSILLRILYEKPYIYYALFILAFTVVLSLLGYRFFKRKYYYWTAYASMISTLGLGFSIVGQHFLKEYQVKRLIVFLDPSIDPLGSGWNILQSITAIGSGGVSGKGFLQGTQSHYRYLPQQSTDFIFSIISEELGFLGGIIVFALFFYILLRLTLSIRNVRSVSSASFVAGIFSIILFHFTINAGMAMGVMPITGIPLLFLSYGGSSLWAICIGVGLSLGIGARRYDS